MILFKPEHIKPILDGQKTQTRRIWKKARVKKGSVHKAKTKLFSKDYFALLKIKDVWKEEFHCLTDEDARKEGGYTREAYIRKFFEINPKLWELTDHGSLPFNVWVVEFEVIRQGQNLIVEAVENAMKELL